MTEIVTRKYRQELDHPEVIQRGIGHTFFKLDKKDKYDTYREIVQPCELEDLLKREVV
jgi:hypothetical protein